MDIFKKRVPFILILGFIAILCLTDNKNLFSEESNIISIKKIWAEKENLENKAVVVCGEYRGWKDDIPNPLITRSDWVVRDGTGAIYVTGKFCLIGGKVLHIGAKIAVKGIVKISKKGVPYIEAKEVIIK